ncbi:MAG: elongation factor 3, partial [Rhodobacterales bacterium CG_4_9_14_3_um_filter_71_31]
MAPPPLLTLTDIALTFGGAPLFSGASLSVGAGERVGVVGRNGSGKSTMLKIAAGLVEADSGVRFAQPGAKIAYLPQEPDLSAYPTLGAYVAADLDEHEHYLADIAMEGLEVRADAPTDGASGGERRRAAL